MQNSASFALYTKNATVLEDALRRAMAVVTVCPLELLPPSPADGDASPRMIQLKMGFIATARSSSMLALCTMGTTAKTSPVLVKCSLEEQVADGVSAERVHPARRRGEGDKVRCERVHARGPRDARDG
jgi:hypothetical protein